MALEFISLVLSQSGRGSWFLSFLLCFMSWLVVPVVTFAEVKLEVLHFDSRHSLENYMYYLFLRVWTCQIESGHTLLHFLYRRGTEVR